MPSAEQLTALGRLSCAPLLILVVAVGLYFGIQITDKLAEAIAENSRAIQSLELYLKANGGG